MGRDWRFLADQRPIVRSKPVIPLKIAEFYSDGLADVRQRAISTRSWLSRTAALAAFAQTIKPIDAWADGAVAAHRSRLLALREPAIAECSRAPANKSASTTMT
jgi:hypothetical protein